MERRKEYIDLLESQIGTLNDDLVELVKQCLHNAPEERPKTNELHAAMKRIVVYLEEKRLTPNTWVSNTLHCFCVSISL